MAIIRSTAAALLRGRVGNTTYYVSGARQVARAGQNSSNYGETARRSSSQQAQRAKWANLVQFYKASKSWMPLAFESKTARQSDYNKFMSVNMSTSNIYLTKEQAALGACVVEAYNISQGSLRSIGVNKSGSNWITDIKTGDLAITDTTTVGSFAAAIIDNNSQVKVGWQLSFISYQQYIDANNIPQVVCTSYEVTLDPTSTELLRNYLPEFCTSASDGYLCTTSDISVGGFAYVWSHTDGGKTSVSTQTIITNNSTLVAQYSSSAQQLAAMESYGLDSDVFLMSGSSAQSAAAGTFYISSIGLVGGRDYGVGSAVEVVSVTEDVWWYIQFSSAVSASAISVKLYLYNQPDKVYTANYTKIEDGQVQCTAFNLPADTDDYVKKIVVTLDGVDYTAQFANGEID